MAKKIFRYYVIACAATSLLLYTGCRPKKTCAAYHSYFLLDPSLQHSHFSPFDKDSIPKAGKKGVDEHGLSSGPTPKNWKKKHYKIVMKDKYPEKEEGGDTSAITGQILSDSI